MSIEDYSTELIKTAKELKELAFEYKKARADYSQALNGLITLIHKASLAGDKASFDNKIPKLLETQFKDEAAMLIKQFHGSQALYKGLEEVLKAYQAHISGIQSVIKYNLSGEVAEATRLKYGGN
ncbi:unknown [Clostridium sp. CAG:306]|jgi:hypothetical protein|nr:unknown [Clostridium sp. CAG:306]